MYEIYFLIFLFGVLGFLFSRVLSKLNTSRDTGKFKNIRLSYSKYIMIISLVIIISSIISTLIEFLHLNCPALNGILYLGQ
ncbi:Uncharacterised protein [uncultured Clostridium sp.]|nr:Uncharacterised protein [uncultured Clostridium sp.]